jgi:cell division protein ZapA
MPLVNVLVNGHAYTLACDEGEEEHLRELAQFLDKRVRELSSSVGQVGDTRLLLMAGLLVSDELSEALSTIEEQQKDIASLKEQAGKSAGANKSADQAAEVLEKAAERLETIAARVARP